MADEDLKRKDDKLIIRFYITFIVLIAGQFGTIASGIWWAGRFEGTTLTRLDNLERQTSSVQNLSTNVAILNTNISNLTQTVDRLQVKIEHAK